MLKEMTPPDASTEVYDREGMQTLLSSFPWDGTKDWQLIFTLRSKYIPDPATYLTGASMKSLLGKRTASGSYDSNEEGTKSLQLTDDYTLKWYIYEVSGDTKSYTEGSTKVFGDGEDHEIAIRFIKADAEWRVYVDG